jgi:hypothetical protein
MSEQNLPGSAHADQDAQAPQQPTPVPYVRLSIHTPPIPARRTSIMASDTGSFELRSPFIFGGFGPSTLPEGDARCASNMVRDAIQAAYAQGRSDGSRYGSIGGSRLGSIHATVTPLPTTSQLVRNQQGLNDPSFQWDETDVNFPPLRRDSEDSRTNDFVGEDLTTNADYQPENLKTIHRQPVQPDVQPQANVPADVHDPAATSSAAFLEPAGQNAATPEQTIEDKIRTFHIPDDDPTGLSQTAPPAQNPDKKIAKKTYDAQKGSVTRMVHKFRSDAMLKEEDYNDLEQRLFALVNDMGLNFAKYSTLITDSTELTAAEDDYQVRYTEAKSVMDNIADWRKQTHSTSSAAPVSVAPPVSVATSTVQTSSTKPPSIDGAKGPSLTADGSSRIQTKTPYSAPSTSDQVSTYPNVLPISTSAPRNVKFSLPSFVALATGATPKGSTQMTRPTGVTTVTSSTATPPSVFPNVQSQSFVPQQTKTAPVVKNIGSDRSTDFQDPRSRRQNKKCVNGQQQQQQRPQPQAQQQQQRQSPPFSDYQKKFDYMEKQIAEQKRLLADAMRMKPPSETDLIQKICRELAAEAAAKSQGDSQRNVPGNPEHTRSSASQQSPQSQPSQNQQPDASHGRVEKLPDHGRSLPFYQDYLGPRGNLYGSVYQPRTDGGTQQPRLPPEQSSPHQQGASASASAPLMLLQVKLPACHHFLQNFGILQLNILVELQVHSTTHLRVAQTSVKKITVLVNRDLFSSQNVTPLTRHRKPNNGRRSERCLMPQSAAAECLMLRNF